MTDLEGQLRSTIISTLTDHLGESQVPFLDMAANQDELARAVMQKARPPFAELGLSLEVFQIQNLSLPDEIQKHLDERIGMGIVGDLSRYTQFQVGQSIPTAAAAPGGAAGVGLGAGIAMGQAMSQVIGQPPPPPPAAGGAPGSTPPGPTPPAPGHGTVCGRCETPLDRPGKFCPECGAPLA